MVTDTIVGRGLVSSGFSSKYFRRSSTNRLIPGGPPNGPPPAGSAMSASKNAAKLERLRVSANTSSAIRARYSSNIGSSTRQSSDSSTIVRTCARYRALRFLFAINRRSNGRFSALACSSGSRVAPDSRPPGPPGARCSPRSARSGPPRSAGPASGPPGPRRPPPPGPPPNPPGPPPWYRKVSLLSRGNRWNRLYVAS